MATNFPYTIIWGSHRSVVMAKSLDKISLYILYKYLIYFHKNIDSTFAQKSRRNQHHLSHLRYGRSSNVFHAICIHNDVATISIKPLFRRFCSAMFTKILNRHFGCSNI